MGGESIVLLFPVMRNKSSILEIIYDSIDRCCLSFDSSFAAEKRRQKESWEEVR